MRTGNAQHRSAAAGCLLACLVLGFAAAWAGAPLERDIVVADLTPTAFTVVWTVDEASTGNVEVFEDVLAATASTGLTVEPALVLGGVPSVGTAAEDLGLLRVRVSGLDPGRAYFFRTVTTPKVAGPVETVPAAGALFSVMTPRDSFPESAKALGAEILDSDGTTPLPGALLLVEIPGAASPLSALAADGYAGSRAAVNLANFYDAGSGSTLAIVGDEIAQITALGGTAGRVETTQALDTNDGLGVQQLLGAALVLQVEADTDSDGMPDDFENANGLDPNVNDGAADADSDGLSNLDEYRHGTDADTSDTDGDGLSDGQEVNITGTRPTEADTDRDGRTDGDEINGPVITDPLDADSDNDGVPDGPEVTAGTDPNDPGDYPLLDGDSDGAGDLIDNCPTIPNPSQTDTDSDGAGDACDGDDDADGVTDGPDNCPLHANAGQEDIDTDAVGDVCDNCPNDANPVQEDNESDGLGDICDPDDDNDGVDDYQDAPPPSDTPFEFTDATAIVSTSLPVVSNDFAYVSVGKFFEDEGRIVRLGFFDLKDRSFTHETVSPADLAKVGWMYVGVDINDCNCFQIVARDSLTVDTDAGNIAVVLPLDAQDLGTILFVSDDGSTWNAYYPTGPLATLLQSSQVAGPLDNCVFVANPLQEDSDSDGIGDLCDITPDDNDGDNVLNQDDNCPDVHNPGQEDLDLDGLGDACDPDDDNDGANDSDEIGLLLTDPRNADTDGDGILDGSEDFDFDGRSNGEEIALGRSPSDPDVELATGLNLFAYPIEVPGGLTAFGLLTALGDDTEVVSVRRLDPLTQTFEEATYVGGVPSGVDFAIVGDEGYQVEMLVNKVITFSGQPDCPTHAIVKGFNLIGFPCFPGGFGASDLLSHLGGPGIAESAQSFDPATGRFESTAWFAAQSAGANQQVAAGRGILVYGLGEQTGVAPPITPPAVAITDPGDGTTTDTTPALISGTIDPPDAVVIVNGVVATLDGLGGFTASVDLVEGANTITATARTTDNLSAADSISVTLDTSVPVDYTLGRPDSVADSRMFNVGPGTLATVNHFHITLYNVPSGVTYAPDSISFNVVSGDVTAPYTISTTAGAAVGVFTFQAEYIFHDDVETELASHTLEFTIEVLP